MSNPNHSKSSQHCHAAGNYSQGSCGKDACHQKANKLSRAYLIGFIFSIILTLLGFFLVTHRALEPQGLYLSLAVLILLQLATQAVFFFRLNMATDDDRWNLVIFLFSLLIMLIVVSGSLWIMYNLNYYMVN